MAIIEFSFEFMADAQASIPQWKQIDAFTAWVDRYHYKPNFHYPKKRKRHPYTVWATVKTDPFYYPPDQEAILEIAEKDGLPMINTLTNSEFRRSLGWDEDKIASVSKMYSDGDSYETRLVTWSGVMHAGRRLYRVTPEVEPLGALLSRVLGHRKTWEPWIPNHPYFLNQVEKGTPS